MTPGARVAAAIEILDEMSEGFAAEQALTRWARRSRFAGSKDRAAVRDHVFDLLRRKRTAAHFGKGHSGRALMIGLLHDQGAPLDLLFAGDGYTPAPLSDDEADFPDAPTETAVVWNLPDWLMDDFRDSLGDKAEATAMALQDRAPVFLRVNMQKTDRQGAVAALADDGIETAPNPLTDSALTVTEGVRKIRNSNAFLTGLVELQDAASQAVVAALPAGGRVLDYCAGGGGKALALAMDPTRSVAAHDIEPKRMADLPNRAARADVQIEIVETHALASKAPFDVILCDAPCSGSGSWRRAAEGKWTLDAERIETLTRTQDQILSNAAQLLAPDGVLAFATCSILRPENEDRVAKFLADHPEFQCTFQRRFDVGPEGDGFFTAHFTRDQKEVITT